MLKELSTFYTIENIYLNYKPRVAYNIGNALSWLIYTAEHIQKQNIVNIENEVEQIYFFRSITSHTFWIMKNLTKQNQKGALRDD